MGGRGGLGSVRRGVRTWVALRSFTGPCWAFSIFCAIFVRLGSAAAPPGCCFEAHWGWLWPPNATSALSIGGMFPQGLLKLLLFELHPPKLLRLVGAWVVIDSISTVSVRRTVLISSFFSPFTRSSRRWASFLCMKTVVS